MKKQKTRSLKDVLEQTLKETGLAEGLETLRIHKAWDELVGSAAAARCVQRSFKNGVYTVCIQSSVLRCQLDMQKSFLKGELNALLSKDLVKELIIR
ncbi:MAG: DUF721 domain-containing protein [Bacteroidales bacterium]|nr:DUF721 domain-containing protein [Bacteroidales bacterium]